MSLTPDPSVLGSESSIAGASALAWSVATGDGATAGVAAAGSSMEGLASEGIVVSTAPRSELELQAIRTENESQPTLRIVPPIDGFSGVFARDDGLGHHEDRITVDRETHSKSESIAIRVIRFDRRLEADADRECDARLHDDRLGALSLSGPFGEESGIRRVGSDTCRRLGARRALEKLDARHCDGVGMRIAAVDDEARVTELCRSSAVGMVGRSVDAANRELAVARARLYGRNFFGRSLAHFGTCPVR